MQKILIARMSAMGDIVHSLPAVAALRQAFPQASIGWIIEDRWLELLAARSAVNDAQRSCAKPLVDVMHIVDTKSWRSSLSSQTKASAVEKRPNLRSSLRAVIWRLL